MANIKQQKKRIRLAARQRLRNRHVKSSLKTLFKQLEAQVADGQTEEAVKTATFLTSRIDKAAAKGVLHKNNAAHKKSRVSRTLARLSA
ncbi:MAG: 30S ribosomal protein S20 [Actinobacteria bacterium]|nr:30S ribosomal protein S20 [Actinomycetota bacterium]